MKRRDPDKKRTRRACVCAFLLSLCLLFMGMGLLIADHTSGRVLFGSDYQTALPAAELSLRWLPARLQLLWELLNAA